MTGTTVGQWTVTDAAPVVGRLGKWYLCECSCGRTLQWIREYALKIGRARRCKKCANARPFRSRFEHVPWGLYGRLSLKVRHAIERCTDETHRQWVDYGGRGIRVHPPWIDEPADFLEHLLSLPGHDDPALWLDRIDNDGHYEPGNLRFVTRSESARNQRPRRSRRSPEELLIAQLLVLLARVPKES